MIRKHPIVNQIMEKRGKKKGTRGITMHLSANTVEGNILPNQKMSAGSWRTTKTPTHQTGSQQRALEGVQGP
jgi:hypothetical protein